MRGATTPGVRRRVPRRDAVTRAMPYRHNTPVPVSYGYSGPPREFVVSFVYLVLLLGVVALARVTDAGATRDTAAPWAAVKEKDTRGAPPDTSREGEARLAAFRWLRTHRVELPETCTLTEECTWARGDTYLCLEMVEDRGVVRSLFLLACDLTSKTEAAHRLAP